MSQAEIGTVGQMGSAGRRERLRAARLYVVSDDQTPLSGLPQLVAAALEGGADVVQLRRKREEPDELLGVARELAALCHRMGALFVVDDHLELAMRAGADGVHLGQEDTPPEQARARLGPAALIGLSTHTAAQADAARALPVDYISAGPVYATPTKAGRPAVGLGYVTAAATRARVPVVAIGGLESGREAVRAGADMVAVVRAVCSAADPGPAARRLRAEAGAAPRWRWIQVNGEARKSPPGEAVDGLLSRLAVDPAEVVIELDGQILPREGLSSTAVTEGSVLEIVHFVGGG